MKSLLLLSFLLAGLCSFAQITVDHPKYHYVSKWELSELQTLSLGSKILFQQDCTTKLPANVPTGIVYFENVFHGKEKLSVAIEFKDTIVASVTYYLKSGQSDALTAIGFSKITARGSSRKGEWTYVTDEKNIHSVLVGDRKKIVVIQTKED